MTNTPCLQHRFSEKTNKFLRTFLLFPFFSIPSGQIIPNIADKMTMKLRKARMISGCFSYCFSKPKVVVYVNNTHNCLCHADLDFRKENLE